MLNFIEFVPGVIVADISEHACMHTNRSINGKIVFSILFLELILEVTCSAKIQDMHLNIILVIIYNIARYTLVLPEITDKILQQPWASALMYVSQHQRARYIDAEVITCILFPNEHIEVCV